MTEIISAIIGAIAAIAVWYFSARDLRKTDLLNKKREIQINFLIEAYRKLESSCHRPLEHDSEFARNIESAIGDIQLFGTQRQVELAQRMSDTLASTGSVTYDDLMNELRKDLREQLRLEALSDKRKIMRILGKNEPRAGGRNAS